MGGAIQFQNSGGNYVSANAWVKDVAKNQGDKDGKAEVSDLGNKPVVVKQGKQTRQIPANLLDLNHNGRITRREVFKAAKRELKKKPQLTAQQKRLMALYGEATGGAGPVVAAKTTRPAPKADPVKEAASVLVRQLKTYSKGIQQAYNRTIKTEGPLMGRVTATVIIKGSKVVGVRTQRTGRARLDKAISRNLVKAWKGQSMRGVGNAEIKVPINLTHSMF